MIPRRGFPLRIILPPVVVAVAVAAGLVWWLVHRSPVETEFQLSRFTFDSGATLGGAISPDGKLVA